MSAELEHGILGALILKTGLLEGVDLTAGDFPEGREREVFEKIAEIWEAERLPEIPLALLVDRIPGSDLAFIAGFSDGTIRPEPAA